VAKFIEMENKRKLFNTDISKGGLIGAIAGSVVSTQFHNKKDHPVKNAAKTGFFATLGYLLGVFLERFFKFENKK
jgi:hypothetical protein